MSGEGAGASNLGDSAVLVLDDADMAAAAVVAAYSAHAGQGCAIGSAKQPSGCESTRSTRRFSESRSGAVVAADIAAAGAVAAFSTHAGQGCAIGSAQQPNGCESTRCSSKSRPEAVVAAARISGRHPARAASVPISGRCFPKAGRLVSAEAQWPDLGRLRNDSHGTTCVRVSSSTVLAWLASQSCRDGVPRHEGTATLGPGPAVRHQPPDRSQDEAIAQLSRTGRRRPISWHARTSMRSSCGAPVLGVRGGR